MPNLRVFNGDLPKWFTLSFAEKRAKVEDFWTDYFRNAPKDGKFEEMNQARRCFQQTGKIPKWFGNSDDMQQDRRRR